MIIQRLFSNKHQKALRKAYDLRRGWGLKEGIAPTKAEIKTQLELSKDRHFQEAIKEDLKKGRALNDRTADIGKTIDSSINSKAVNHSWEKPNLLNRGNASELRLRPKKLAVSKKYLKKISKDGYDHGPNYKDPSYNVDWNKEEMELRLWKKFQEKVKKEREGEIKLLSKEGRSNL